MKVIITENYEEMSKKAAEIIIEISDDFAEYLKVYDIKCVYEK